jgi:glycosyltransferase involved in cell wall biosynthesis
MRSATTLIALTQAEVASYEALGAQSPCRIVPNGVDIEDFQGSVGRSDCSRFDIAPDETVILFMARLHPIKGADRLIQAFLAIQSRFPKVKLVMAGPDEWGLVEMFRQQILNAEIGNRVLFPGMVTGEAKRELLARSDLFCLPSDAEGFSMAILEAMANKTPVLITPGCHFPDVETVNAGKIVQCSIDGLTQALSSLLEDKERLIEMGENGYRLVKSDYDWDRIVESLITVYNEGISRQSKSLQPALRAY